jgi:hypothetical protein
MATHLLHVLPLEAGLDVRIAQGWGTVRTLDSARGRCTVDLNEPTDGSSQGSVVDCSGADILDRCQAVLGSVVLTKYGIGIMLDFRRRDSIHVLRMWGLGNSVATAYMSSHDIIK